MRKIKITISPEFTHHTTVQQFVKELPHLFDQEGKVLYDKRNIIKSFVVDKLDETLQNVVVKRYKYPNFIQRIGYSFFRSSKAEKAFRNAGILRQHGFDTPQEIAYLEQWNNGLFEYGFFLSGYDGAPPILEKLTKQGGFDCTIVEDFAKFAVRLHESGILNHDLNATNVLYHPSGNHYRFSLIDINRIDFSPKGKLISQRDCLENLTRFTGRADLFESVIRCYAQERNWNVEETLNRAILIKKKHDLRWKQRKAFLRIFK